MLIKMSAICLECDKAGVPKNGSFRQFVELNDENLYRLSCPNGHQTHTTLQEKKFEILFDQGAIALLDGYSRESVANFASSFERFIEFFLKVVSYNNSIDNKPFSNTWKLMSKQSERQLGAFYFMQLIVWGDLLFALKESNVAFRNKVIHQGYIPTTEEAIEYGDYILRVIHDCLKKLKETHRDAIFMASISDEIEKGILEDINRSTLSIPTIINLRAIDTANFGEINLRDTLKLISKAEFYDEFYKKSMI